MRLRRPDRQAIGATREATDRLGSITKQGSATARFILGQLVMHVLRRDAWMKGWYGRIKRRRGSKIARVAVMRRLATIIWHMVKNDQPYLAGSPAWIQQTRELDTSLRSGGTSARARPKGVGKSPGKTDLPAR